MTALSGSGESSVSAAVRVLEIESEAIRQLIPRIGAPFLRALEIALECRGKIAVVGMGKSGLICKKIAATLSSTGTPAFFLHAAEAFHGDLGLLSASDVVIILSNSGETPEILQILNISKRLGLPVIAFSGNPESTLARHADINLDVSVTEEACPFGLAPTTSTAAALAMGDALAMTLMKRKDFKREDFATLHPAGALGKKLLRVGELMHCGDSIPRVLESTPMAEVIYEMSRKGLGMTTVADASDTLAGVISDGDLRRLLQRSPDPLKLVARECMTTAPKTISEVELGATALARMEELKITSLVVVDSGKKILGVLHIHDLWRTQMF